MYGEGSDSEEEEGRETRRSTHPHAVMDSDGLRGKYRFRAVVRKVILNMAWLAEAPAEEEVVAEHDERKWERAMLRAKSRRRREGGQLFSLEEKVLFNKPSYARSSRDLEKAFGIIQRIKAFQNFSEEVQRGLAETLYFVFLNENRVVLKEGQEPISMYFILQGDVLISLAKTDPYTGAPLSEQVAMLTAGDMFGEVALLQGINRTATVTTASVVEMLGLHRDDFATVLHKTLEMQWRRFREELARFSYFDGWTETQIREACILGRLRSFEKDETVLGDGCGTVEYAYFLLNGACRLVQALTVEVWEEFGDTVYRLLDDPTLVAVRPLPDQSAAAGTPQPGDDRMHSTVAAELAVQDEWNIAALRLAAAIGTDPTAQRWRSARVEVEHILKKEEPFKYKTIVHKEAWDNARRRVLETLGEHSSRATGASESSEAMQQLFGKGRVGTGAGAGVGTGAVTDRISTMPGVAGRKLGMPSFVGRPSVLVVSSSTHGDEDAHGAAQHHVSIERPSYVPRPATLDAHTGAMNDLASRASKVGVSLLAVPPEGQRNTRGKPLQLEMVRGHRSRPSRHSTRHRTGSFSDDDEELENDDLMPKKARRRERLRSIVAFASDSERQDTVKLRHAFEDPFARTPRQRRMSLACRASIRNSWMTAVSLLMACLDMCEESEGSYEDVEELQACWRHVRKGVERLMKREQTPLMQPEHRLSTHYVQVCFYTPLQVFGIGESMDQRRVSAMHTSECLLLPRYWLDQNNVGNVWERVRLYLNRQIPDSRTVFRAWAAERRWLRHRTHLVSELINKRHINSGTTPFDVPYFLRLQEVTQPHELGYERRFVIRPKGNLGPIPRKSSFRRHTVPVEK